MSYIQSNISYKEPNIMNEKGTLKGVQGDFLFRLTPMINLNFEGKLIGGNLEYTGSTFDGDPVTQTTDDSVREYKGHLQFVVKNFVPYVGYGYRYWRNDLVISYVRDTTYYYMPVGLKFIKRPWYLGYEYRNFIKGINESFMSDVGGGRKDVTFNQDTGTGYALEGGFIWRISKFDVKIGLSYERWEVDDSDTSFDGVDTLIEPHNSTNVLSLTAGIFF